MLVSGQEIVYFRNGVEIARLDDKSFSRMSHAYCHYFRHDQPFTSQGQQLMLPLRDTDELARTSKVTDSPHRHENRLDFSTTSGNVYGINYVGIDIEAVLRDGKGKGVNEHHRFPVASQRV